MVDNDKKLDHSLDKDPSIEISHGKNSTGVDGACGQELKVDTPKVDSLNLEKIDTNIDVCRQEAEECKVVTVWKVFLTG